MTLVFSPLPIAALVNRRLDQYALSLSQPEGLEFDFSQPVGEPSLVGPDSVSWQVFKNPVTLYIGGIAAVLLELAEPQIRDGVWQHSGFRTDALRRMQRTGLAAMITVYGARSRAEQMIEGVNRRHRRVTGVTTEGEAYRADDPILLDWVQATASFGFMEAYSRYAQPLDDREKNRLLSEGRAAADLYGAKNAPTTLEDLHLLFGVMRNRLVKSEIIFEFLKIMNDVKILPAPLRPLQGLMTKAAIEILPPWIRDRLELHGPRSYGSMSKLETRFVRILARAANRMVLPSSAPVQACKRLGLPNGYLYRKQPRPSAQASTIPQVRR